MEIVRSGLEKTLPVFVPEMSPEYSLAHYDTEQEVNPQHFVFIEPGITKDSRNS